MDDPWAVSVHDQWNALTNELLEKIRAGETSADQLVEYATKIENIVGPEMLPMYTVSLLLVVTHND